jgi:iron complex transport system permease protein
MMSRWIALIVAALAVLVVGISVGAFPIPPTDVWRALWGQGDAATVAIVRDLRVPRALLAFLVGGSLAVCGASLQAVVRNPLADPFLLGLSGGAGLGAVLAIALHLRSIWAIPASAFAGALVAVALVYRLALVTRSVLDGRVLLLAGVVVGAFMASLMSAVLAVSPAAELRNALLWLMGGLGGASWQSLGVFAVYAVIPLAFILAAARPLDLLSLGEDPARFLGADVERLKRLLYLSASLLTAAAVAVSGIIGFVGLVVPHGVRIRWGHVHLVLLPAAFLAGGSLLVVADAVARMAFAPVELPVGVVTALVGVPVFAVLIRRWNA